MLICNKEKALASTRRGGGGGQTPVWVPISRLYRVSGLSCPEAQAYLTVIFHSFLHNNNINSDYILGANIYFTPHSIFSSYF